MAHLPQGKTGCVFDRLLEVEEEKVFEVADHLFFKLLALEYNCKEVQNGEDAF